jgi:hypothetical protein
MPVLEVRAKKLGPVLSGKPGRDEDGGDEEDGKYEPNDLVHVVTKDTAALKRPEKVRTTATKADDPASAGCVGTGLVTFSFRVRA